MAPASRRSPDDEAGQGAEVVERADAARRDQREARAVQGRGQPVEVGTGERAVTADLGDDHGGDAGVLEAGQHVEHRVARAPPASPARPPRRRGRRGRPRRAGDAAMRATSAGSSMAAVPITTRATPASARAAAAASDRTPPPLWTCTPSAATAARCAPTTARFSGSPERAASRSTTWIHRAPAAANPSATEHRVVAVDRLLLVVALVEAHAAAAAQVDGRVELDHRRTIRSARARPPRE